MGYVGGKLEGEKIANVLIGFLSGYHKVKNLLTGATKKELQGLLKKLKDSSGDEDVLFYVDKVMDE